MQSVLASLDPREDEALPRDELYLGQAARSMAPAGYDVGVNPTVLIESVVVAPAAPAWLLELVQAVCRRYEVDAQVVQSELDAEPV